MALCCPPWLCAVPTGCQGHLCLPSPSQQPGVAAHSSSHQPFLTFAVSLGFSNEIPGFKCQLSRGDAIVFSSMPFSWFQNTWQSYYK